MTMIEVKGYGFRVRFDGQFIVIRRGAVARGAGGTSQSVIALSDVVAVEWRPAGVWTNGYIRFRTATAGEMRVVAGVPFVAQDGYAALFTIWQRRRFERLRKAVDGALASRAFEVNVPR